MSVVRLISLAGAVALLAGCGASRYCSGVQPYQTAVDLPPLATVEGLGVPESQAALRVPAGPTEGPGYAETYEDQRGRERIRCLDMPPPLPAEVLERDQRSDDA
jgi:uncharacterized lipoprotein